MDLVEQPIKDMKLGKCVCVVGVSEEDPGVVQGRMMEVNMFKIH